MAALTIVKLLPQIETTRRSKASVGVNRERMDSTAAPPRAGASLASHVCRKKGTRGHCPRRLIDTDSDNWSERRRFTRAPWRRGRHAGPRSPTTP